jgi:class 3 adenylate cyclase
MEPEIPVCLERRLAAILAADVAGYSRLIEADEEGTLRRLKALRREVVDPKLAEHRGRIVKTTGDGLLVEFASVVDALRSAAEVQAALAEGNEPVGDGVTGYGDVSRYCPTRRIIGEVEALNTTTGSDACRDTG